MIEEFITQMSPGRAALCFLGALVVLFTLRKMQVSMKIARLGGRAPQVRFYLPYGTWPEFRSSWKRSTCANRST